MSKVLTRDDKQLLKQLQEAGHWGSESEIIRYGLFLVKKEIGQLESLAPYSKTLLRKAARRATSQDEEEDSRLASASARYRP
jgi:Arc/MetJ-type ribon-helix-helix transcriptional regulator